MAREAQAKQIKEWTYTVHQLPPKKALDLLMDLAKMVGPAFGMIVSDVGNLKGVLDKDIGDIKTAFLGEAVKVLFSGLDKATVMRSIETLAEVTSVTTEGGQGAGANLKTIFDAHFQGNLGALMQWLPFALQVQYDDFFGGLGNVITLVSPAPKVKLPPA